MTGSPTFLSPLALLLLGAFGFAGWLGYDATWSDTGTAGTEARPLPEPEWIEPHSVPLQVAPGQPPLQPGMPREIVERIIGPIAPEEFETTDTVRGVPVRRVTYRLPLPDGCGGPTGWHRVTVEFDARDPAQVVSHVSVSLLPEDDLAVIFDDPSSD